MIISKEFNMAMSHFLKRSYSRECQNIHGHNYNVVIKLHSNELNDDNMIIDYKMLNGSIIKEIESIFDHSMIVPIELKNCNLNNLNINRIMNEDGNLFLHHLIHVVDYSTERIKLVLVNRNTTTEIIALLLFQLISEKIKSLQLSNNVELHSILVKESQSTSCEVYKDDIELMNKHKLLKMETIDIDCNKTFYLFIFNDIND